MRLNPGQRAQFEEEGYLFLPDLFGPDEMAALNAEVPRIL
ncbi:MAG: proline hydroxylase, partial [Alphaproteobacteria bacterium]|nr:proline hydroxylase [Alphaproteobacteria bacterium]